MDRREFLRAAGIAGLAGAVPALSAEPAPETARIRLTQAGGLCFAPLFVAEQLLRVEGFTDVQYVSSAGGLDTTRLLVRGDVDISMRYVASNVLDVDAGQPLTMLAGIHPGCFELIGGSRVKAARDLKDKTVAIVSEGSTQHVFLAAVAAQVGLKPRNDIKWIEVPLKEQLQHLADERVDAVMTFPPVAQEARVKRVGRVIVNSVVDKPWSQYFCCSIIASRDFVRKHPAASKRALRALLKATDLCATNPASTARYLVERKFADNYDHALQAMKDIPYRSWREYSAEDSVRFWALRLHDTGFVRSVPNRIISDGTDWRFLNELKKELKA